MCNREFWELQYIQKGVSNLIRGFRILDFNYQLKVLNVINLKVQFGLFFRGLFVLVFNFGYIGVLVSKNYLYMYICKYYVICVKIYIYICV